VCLWWIAQTNRSPANILKVYVDYVGGSFCLSTASDRVQCLPAVFWRRLRHTSGRSHLAGATVAATACPAAGIIPSPAPSKTCDTDDCCPAVSPEAVSFKLSGQHDCWHPRCVVNPFGWSSIHVWSVSFQRVVLPSADWLGTGPDVILKFIEIPSVVYARTCPCSFCEYTSATFLPRSLSDAIQLNF
jgi:hypothetical protein